eukprot:4719619-Ditylum_brightwellii.AAC.1
MWLTRYLWPQKVILDRGMEFLKDSIVLVCDKCGIKQKLITTGNSQTTSMVERAHQIIGNLLHIFEIGKPKLDPDNPYGGILWAVMLAL